MDHAFKAKVGLEAVRGVMTVNEIGQAHEVQPVQLSQWKRVIQEQAAVLFDGKHGPKAAAPDKTEALYSEIGRLKMELDSLLSGQNSNKFNWLAAAGNWC